MMSNKVSKVVNGKKFAISSDGKGAYTITSDYIDALVIVGPLTSELR